MAKSSFKKTPADLKSAFYNVNIPKTKGDGIQRNSDDDVLTPYKSQNAGDNTIGYNRLGIATLPTGWGKTLLFYLQVIRFFKKMKKNKKAKFLLLVPQLLIAKDFGKMKIKTSKNEIVTIEPTRQNSEDDTIKQEFLEDFVNREINNKSEDFNDRFMVCCYQTFINFYNNLKDKSILNNIMIGVDEAHHLENTENSLGGIESNLLGGIVHEIFDNNTTRLLLATATYFRGDGRGILSRKMMKEAVKYNMTLDKMLSDINICPNLKEIGFAYILRTSPLYKIATEINDMGEINEEDRFTGWYIPNVNSSDSTGKVSDDKSIRKSFGKRVTDKNELLSLGLTEEEIEAGKNAVDYYVTTKGFVRKVVDLALDDKHKLFPNWINRDNREDFLVKYQNDRKTGKYKWITDVIALNKMKEGTNWKPMNRIVIVGYRNSLVDQIQIIGRGFRDWDGKKRVEIINVISRKFNHLNEEETAKQINDLLKCIYGIMCIEDLVSPFYLNLDKISKKQTKELIKQHNILTRLFENKEDKRTTFEYSVAEDLFRKCDGMSEKEAKPHFKDIVALHLGNADISATSEEIDEVSYYMWRKTAYRLMISRGIDMSKIDMNCLDAYSIADGCMYFLGKSVTPKLFRELKSMYESYKKKEQYTMKTAIKALEKMQAAKLAMRK